MTIQMKPYEERTPDMQYRELLQNVIQNGKRTPSPQGIDRLSVICPPQFRFELTNGFPVITERNITFWRQPIGEMCAFINGMRTVEGLKKFGCHYWKDWADSPYAVKMGLKPGDLGPGSYGPAFHDFPMPPENADETIDAISELILQAEDASNNNRSEATEQAIASLEKLRPRSFNQFKHLVEQIRELPYLATHEISPWIPYYTVRGEGKERRVIVAPCHGWVHVEILDDILYLEMRQRSADIILGLPSNLVQYSALALMLAHLTGYRNVVYIHRISNAHIYENQFPWVEEILARAPWPFPVLSLTEEGRKVNDIHAFRREHFTLSDYNPHLAISGIPVAP